MDFDDSEFDNFIQIGKGSYGTVFGNQNKVFKLMNLIMIDNDKHFAFNHRLPIERKAEA